MSRLLAVIVAIGLGLATVVGLLTWVDERAAPRLVIEQSPLLGTVSVEVRGAVLKPGTYTLATGSRYGDAIDAAGGFAPDADLSAVNVARRIGQPPVVEIPATQPTVEPTATKPPRTAVAKASATHTPVVPPPSGGGVAVIDINRADAATLEELPGIGPTLAARIVDDRAANGPYPTVDDLARVKGISPRMIDEMRSQVTAK